MGRRNWNFNIVGSVGQFPNYTIPTKSSRQNQHSKSPSPQSSYRARTCCSGVRNNKLYLCSKVSRICPIRLFVSP